MNTFLTTTDQKVKIEYLNKFSLDLEFYLPKLLICNKNCAYALANLTKKKKAQEILLSNQEKYEKLILEFLTSQDAKIRKYAYIICGNLPTKKLYSYLLEQIEKEKTYLTLPSLMLSLVGKDCELLLQRIEKEKNDIAPKLYQEIVGNYNKVLPQEYDRCTTFNFDTLPCILQTQKCYEDYIIKELKSYKVQKLKCGIKLQEITPQIYQNIAKRRDIYSLSLLLEQNTDLTLCLNNGLKLLDKVIGKGNFAYRISCQNKELNSSILKAIKTIDLTNLSNSANNYSISVEIIENNKEFLMLACLESCKVKFTYRQGFLPASINPVTANIICKIANYYNPNAKVVADTFCGTATMLVERKFVKEDITLIGSDISQIAIDKAKTNLKSANINAKLIKCDIANFKEKNIDEIISNLPYGLRVGSHNDNFKIYKDLVKVLKNSLKVGGYGFLYTADKKLLKNLIRQNKLTLVEELPFISGGLYCSLFIVKK